MQNQKHSDEDVESVRTSLIYAGRTALLIVTRAVALTALLFGVIGLSVYLASFVLPDEALPLVGVGALTLIICIAGVFMKRRYEVQVRTERIRQEQGRRQETRPD